MDLMLMLYGTIGVLAIIGFITVTLVTCKWITYLKDE